MTLWLVGAGGMLGQAFRSRLDALRLAYEATGSELDVTNRDAVMSRARSGAYRTIVNCAAYTAVDEAESDAARAMAVNGAGPGNLGAAAREIGADIVHFSTDYVFDGQATEPYLETAPTNPLGVYGRSKLEGERRLEQAMSGAGPDQRALIIRTSWLFGRRGKSFVSTMLGLMRRRETLEVVSDQVGRPTYCPDLVGAALALAGLTRESRAGSGIYHFANVGSTSWHGFACEILRQARDLDLGVVTQRIDPIATSEMRRPAPRPAFSVLATERIERELGVEPPPWRTGVSRFLSEVVK